MPVQLFTQKEKRQVGEIVSADAQFVSVVRNAANRQGIRVIKSESVEEAPPIQSVLVPSDTTLEELAKQDGLAWLNDVSKQEVIDRGAYREYPQLPRDKFDEGSLKMQWVEGTKAFAVVGTLKDGEKADLIAMPNYGMAEASIPGLRSKPFNWFLGDEIRAFETTTQGLLGQTQLSPTDRNDGIMKSYEALGAFLTASLDAVGDLPSSTPIAESKEDNEGEFDMTMFKNKEEYAEFLGDVIDARLTSHGLIGKEKEETTPVTTQVVTQEAKTDNSGLAEIKTLIQGLTTKIESQAAKQDELAEKQDKIAARFVTQSHKADESPETEEREETWEDKFDEFPSGVPKEYRQGVFSGILFGHRQ